MKSSDNQKFAKASSDDPVVYPRHFAPDFKVMGAGSTQWPRHANHVLTRSGVTSGCLSKT